MLAAGIAMAGLWNATISAIATRPLRKEPIVDNDKAFGAMGIAGQSTAGRIHRASEMPTNAAVISAMNRRTPNKNGHTSSKLEDQQGMAKSTTSLPKYW